MAASAPLATPLSALDRRTLLRGGALGAGFLGMPLSAAMSEMGFTHGVASGEPRQDRVLLWTRFVGDSETSLEWQVSDTLDFGRIVSGGTATARDENDFCCKAFAEGLEPGKWYYYRFVAPGGAMSDIGRTKTLPEGPVERFRMAVFSCSNIGAGWFNAYAHAAAANEFDCAVHLGDYLYEVGGAEFAARGNAIPGRIPEGPELVQLADYRQRYAQYRRDPDLRRLHQLYPMIAGWDDHESANNSYVDGAENHQPETEGPWSARKAAAMRVYREWMPVSEEPWTAYEIGDLATLFRLETRLTARTEQFSLMDLLRDSGGSPERYRAALATFRDEKWRDPTRQILGRQQETWLAEGFRRSRRGGKVWQVLAQQVIMGRQMYSPTMLDAIPDTVSEQVRRRVTAGALATQEGIPVSMDAWDGYPTARARIFEAALGADSNLISLAGDSHNAWSFELDHEGTPVGVEFAGHSVTSSGADGYLSSVPADRFARDAVAASPQLKWMDASQRGYMAVELTPGRATSEYRFVTNVRQRSSKLAGSKRITTLAGSRRLDIG